MNESLKWALKEIGFTREIERAEHGFCSECGEAVSIKDFKDEISIKEYKNGSGYCQGCQDEIFRS